ncbi:MAG: hypothetical protein ACREE4_13735 [Stellaceae bacterium]
MAFGDLTTLVDVKAWLQTAPGLFPSSDDTLLARLITAASQFIIERLGRPILSADYIEVRDGTTGFWGQSDARFPFAVTPCTAVLSVVVDNIAVPPVPALTPGAAGIVQSLPVGFQAGYLFSPTQIVIRGYFVPRRAQCVTIQYTSGHPSVPADLQQACIELVCLRYRERQRIGEVSKHLGGEVVTYLQKDMSASTLSALARYRLVAPIASMAPQLAPTQTDSAIVGAVLA